MHPAIRFLKRVWRLIPLMAYACAARPDLFSWRRREIHDVLRQEGGALVEWPKSEPQERVLRLPIVGRIEAESEPDADQTASTAGGRLPVVGSPAPLGSNH